MQVIELIAARQPDSEETDAFINSIPPAGNNLERKITQTIALNIKSEKEMFVKKSDRDVNYYQAINKQNGPILNCFEYEKPRK